MLVKQKIAIHDMTIEELKTEIAFCCEMINRYEWYKNMSGVKVVKKQVKTQNRLENCIKQLKSKGGKV